MKRIHNSRGTSKSAVTSAHSAPVRHLPLLAAALLAALVNINTLQNGFLLDDESQVQRNQWIQDWRNIPRMFAGNVWSFSGSAAASNYYRPMMHVIYLVTFKLFGLKPWGFHLVNVMFHVLNTVLLLLVASLLAARSRIPAAKSAWLSVPFIAAALFATHPVHSEAIAWIASLPELSFTAFFLASLALYLNPAQKENKTLILSSVCYAVSLLCKETAITLPAVLIACDVCFPEGRRRQNIYRRFAPYVLITVAYLLIRHATLGQNALPVSPLSIGAEKYIAVLIPLFATYVAALFAPFRLYFWHTITPLGASSGLAGLMSLLVVILFVVGTAIAWKKNRFAFFCIAFFFFTLTPAFNVTAIAGKPYAERYAYLPSAGFVLLAGALIFQIAATGMRQIAIFFLAALVAACSAGTFSRNRAWKDFLTLYADTMSKAPGTPVPCNDLARNLFQQSRTDEAVDMLQQAVSKQPNDADCESALGSALLLKDRVDEAIVHLNRAIQLNPASLDSLNDLGVALRRAGKPADAVKQYEKALEMQPDYPDAHFNLAAALADAGDIQRALKHYREAVRLRPTDAYYHNVLGIECARQNLIDEAIQEFEQSVRLAPQEPAYQRNLDRARSMRSN